MRYCGSGTKGPFRYPNILKYFLLKVRIHVVPLNKLNFRIPPTYKIKIQTIIYLIKYFFNELFINFRNYRQIFYILQYSVSWTSPQASAGLSKISQRVLTKLFLKLLVTASSKTYKKKINKNNFGWYEKTYVIDCNWRNVFDS